MVKRAFLNFWAIRELPIQSNSRRLKPAATVFFVGDRQRCTQRVLYVGAIHESPVQNCRGRACPCPYFQPNLKSLLDRSPEFQWA